MIPGILIKRLKKNDKAAFDEFYHLSHEILYSYIYDIVGDKRVTENLLQETYLAIYIDLINLDEDRFDSYCKQKALKVCNDYLLAKNFEDSELDKIVDILNKHLDDEDECEGHHESHHKATKS